MLEKAQIEGFRRLLKPLADDLMRYGRQGDPRGEVIANLTLAYRHLEDASMRLGKCIQAIDGGISVYDRDQVPAVQSDG